MSHLSNTFAIALIVHATWYQQHAKVRNNTLYIPNKGNEKELKIN